MANISVTHTFSNSTTADATQVNTNFTDIINGTSDGTKDMSISALTLAGALTANGNTVIGNASSDTLTVTASLASTINIGTTYSYDIGSATIGLKRVYFGSIDSAARTTLITAGTVSSSNTCTLPIVTCILTGQPSALTSTRIPYVDSNGHLVDSSGLTFDSTNKAISISGLANSSTSLISASASNTGTGSSATTVRINNTDATNTGDVALEWSVAAQNWYMGIDNSATDALKIGAGSTWDSAPIVELATAGNFAVGSTSPADVSHTIKNTSTSNYTIAIQNASTSTSSDAIYGMKIVKGSTTNTAGVNRFIIFQINAAGTNSGYIGSNGADAAAFFSTSDRRLKQDVSPVLDGLELVERLNPVYFKWKSTKQEAVGFIAQELNDVLPRQVVKTDDGNGDAPINEPWGMTESGMIPYLVSAIQALSSKVKALQAKVGV